MFGDELLDVLFGCSAGEFIHEFIINVEPDIGNAAHGLLRGQVFFLIHINYSQPDGVGIFDRNRFEYGFQLLARRAP